MPRAMRFGDSPGAVSSRVEGAGWLAPALCRAAIAAAQNPLLSTIVGRRTQFFCRVSGLTTTSPSCYRVKWQLGHRIDTFTAGLQAAPVSSCCAGERVVRTMHVAACCQQQTSACHRAPRCRYNATIRWPDRLHCSARRCRSGHRRVAWCPGLAQGREHGQVQGRGLGQAKHRAQERGRDRARDQARLTPSLQPLARREPAHEDGGACLPGASGSGFGFHSWAASP